jgi:hypothetical protein
MGIDALHIRGYESKEIWLRDELFCSAMLEHLRMSPIFSSGLSMGQLQSTLTSLQRAFQNEEVRVTAVIPQRIDVNSRAEVINYYTHAVLLLDPLLLPRISMVALGSSRPPTAPFVIWPLPLQMCLQYASDPRSRRARDHSVPQGMDVGHIFQCIAVPYLLFVRQAYLQTCQDKVSLEERFMVFDLG